MAVSLQSLIVATLDSAGQIQKKPQQKKTPKKGPQTVTEVHRGLALKACPWASSTIAGSLRNSSLIIAKACLEALAGYIALPALSLSLAQLLATSAANAK